MHAMYIPTRSLCVGYRVFCELILRVAYYLYEDVSTLKYIAICNSNHELIMYYFIKIRTTWVHPNADIFGKCY